MQKYIKQGILLKENIKSGIKTSIKIQQDKLNFLFEARTRL